MRQEISCGPLTTMSLTSAWPMRVRALKPGALISSSVYLTSSAVKGVPSCQVTPSRSLTFQARPPSEMPPLASVGTSTARSGMRLPLGSATHIVLKICIQTVSSTSMPGISGLKAVGSCDRPTTTCPVGLRRRRSRLGSGRGRRGRKRRGARRRRAQEPRGDAGPESARRIWSSHRNAASSRIPLCCYGRRMRSEAKPPPGFVADIRAASRFFRRERTRGSRLRPRLSLGLRCR